jgi:nitroimidazol reductase NimA-like FMN-containing flavoprotein (pyridoxamine 5'-phosphate oxidase superfamily)
MRRKDREILDRDRIEEIIERASVCRIALTDGETPYIVPLNFGYRDSTLYFHSAPEGRKIDMIREHGRVCFELDADRELVESGKPCGWSMKYRSVIGFGEARIVDDPAEKRDALRCIIDHYSPGNPYEFTEEDSENVAIIEVAIESMSGKESGY